jgi:hypothetical protein
MTPTELHVHFEHLTPGDILPGQGGRHYQIVTIHYQRGGTYAIEGVFTDTGEPMTTTLYAGHGMQRVLGGPKFDALEQVWHNTFTGKHIWKPEAVSA